MEKNMITEMTEKETKAKKVLKIFYIIQGVFLVIGLIGLFASVGYQMDSGVPADEISVINSFLSIICSAIVAVGFFCRKDKLIGRTWFVWAILGFLLDILPVMLGRNAFSLVPSAFFMIFRIFLAKGFVSNDKDKLNPLIKILPMLLGLYVAVVSIYAGIISAESVSYYKSETEAFFEGMSGNLLENVLVYIATYAAAYNIILIKCEKIKLGKIKKARAVQTPPQPREMSVSEKADLLKEYKTMLDDGIITEEEYGEKKNSILN